MPTNGAHIPEYLNEDLLQDALNDGFKRKDIKVKNLNLKLISEGGENYCSDIYRANVEYTTDGNATRHIALIVKNMKASFGDVVPLESKEIDMYTQVVPKMEEILGEVDLLAPKCFRATKDHNELYVFQDLVDLGYAVQDRLKGLNEEQSHLLLQKIGVFHAASMVVAEKYPVLMKRVGASPMTEGINKIPMFADLLYNNLEYVTELVREWDGFEGIAIKLQKLRKTFEEKLISMANSNQSKFKVLNHGDLWVNNIMFKYDKDTCVDMKLIDLQMCNCGSPGIDLHYFLTTSVPLDLALTKKYDLLRSYYRSLKSTLLRLNYSPIPSWDDLLNELRVTEFHALQTALIALPLICLDKAASKGSDVDSLTDSNFMKKQRVLMFKSKRTLAVTRHILDRLNDLGVLD